MSEARSERRRLDKKKMQDTRVITQKGGHQVRVVTTRAVDRVNRIRNDPEFARFRAAYAIVLERPPQFGADPFDPPEVMDARAAPHQV
jgi:hypothetical protein